MSEDEHDREKHFNHCGGERQCIVIIIIVSIISEDKQTRGRSELLSAAS